MAISKQTDLIEEFFTKLNDEEKLLCKPVVEYLFELGYTAKKK